MLRGIEVLEAVFQFSDGLPIYEIPEENAPAPIGQWPLYDLLFMISLLLNKQTKLPGNYRDLVRIIKLADYWGGDEVLRIISQQLQLPTHRLTNLESTHRLKQLLRGAYRASKHWAHKGGALGRCGLCEERLAPRRVLLAPCCGFPYHYGCEPKHSFCPKCHRHLGVLPCVYCLQSLTISVSNYYDRFAIASRTRSPCCGADCHPECVPADNKWHNCPLCSCPLTEWKIDHLREGAGDVLARRRENRYNDVRRARNLGHYGRDMFSWPWNY